MRRRIATIATAVGAAGFLMFMSAGPANAAVSWESRGLAGTKAWGSTWRDTVDGKKVQKVKANIKDTAKDGYHAAIKVKWTESGKDPVVKVAWNPHGYNTTATGTLRSYNINHTYIKECVGTDGSGRFKAARCGDWHRIR